MFSAKSNQGYTSLQDFDCLTAIREEIEVLEAMFPSGLSVHWDSASDGFAVPDCLEFDLDLFALFGDNSHPRPNGRSSAGAAVSSKIQLHISLLGPQPCDGGDPAMATTHINSLSCQSLSRAEVTATQTWLRENAEHTLTGWALGLGQALEHAVSSTKEDPPADPQTVVPVDVRVRSPVFPDGGTTTTAGEAPPAHEQLFCRQWITFLSFTTKKIAQDFAALARSLGLRGFLVTGKPGLCCVEAPAPASATRTASTSCSTNSSPLVEDFISRVRRDVFATVDRSSRKMTVSVLEEGLKKQELCFGLDFPVLEFVCERKRGDDRCVDMNALVSFLVDKAGVPVEVVRRVTMQ